MDSVKPKTRKEAKALGSKFYNTGKPCKFGNFADRLVSGRCTCRDCKDVLKKISSRWYHKTKPKRLVTEQKRQQNKEWKKNNKSKVNAINATRRAAKKKSIPTWFSEFDEFVIAEAFDLCQKREIATNIKWTVDHMIPLQSKVACGLHCAENIQVIPESLNAAKRNKMILTNPFEWL